MQFALDKFTSATCTHVSKRTENHGDDLVHAKDLFWRIEGPNTLLDLIHPSLRQAIYKHAGTKVLPGMEDITPELRTSLIEGPFSVKYEGSGYMLTVRFGEVSGEQIELGGSELAKMKVDPKEGGTCVIIFRTSHHGLSMEEMGRLDTFDGKELSILLAPPALQTGTPGKRGKKAEPEADTKTAPLPFKTGEVQPAKGPTEAFIESAKKPAAPASKTAPKKKPTSLKAKMQKAAKK